MELYPEYKPLRGPAAAGTNDCKGYHAWHSERCATIVGSYNLAMVDGKEVPYTGCTREEGENPHPGWKDSVYLGVIERVTYYGASSL